MTIVLGIETSCDETAIALIHKMDDGTTTVLGQQLSSQIHIHAKYGGVVPEIASRNHLDIISHLYYKLLDETAVSEVQIDVIAVTAGPGLIGGLLVGVVFAKGLALRLKKPLIGVNHLEGHALVITLTNGIIPPFLLLLVSGGHCQIIKINNVGDYQCLGKTRDDSIGEAFDKVAKMLGLSYPGGPIIEERAKLGIPAIDLPIPILKDARYEFSFSGLKSAIKRKVDLYEGKIDDVFINNMAASFQEVVAKVLSNRLNNVIEDYSLKAIPVVISGGVAANQYLLNHIKSSISLKVAAPPIKLCTDNAVMIAWAGLCRYEMGQTDDLSLEPRSRWPIEDSLHNAV